MENLEHISKFMEDIDRLQKRSKLLSEILRYYDRESMTFIVPEKWKNNVKIRKLPAESPRHLLLDKIKNLLEFNDLEELMINNKSDYF